MWRNKFFPAGFCRLPVFLFPVAITLLSILLLSSCDNEAGIIGETLQPPSEKFTIVYTDTVTLNAFTLSRDSIRSDNISRALLGSIQDPVFGKSEAGFFCRVRLAGTDAYPEAFIPGDDAVADSIVLYILPDRFYGDPETQMNMRIFRLTEDVLRDSVYYSNYIPGYDPASEVSSVISVNDTLIKVVMDPSFFGIPLSEVDTIATNAELRDFFKGIYVTSDAVPVAGEGAIMIMDILSAASTMMLYYRRADTLLYAYPFGITAYSARVNLFDHDYSSSGISHLNDTLVEDTLIYVQGMGGTYAKITFPFLGDFGKEEPMAVNKAEITFRIWEYYDTTRFPRPPSLDFLRMDANGNFTTFFDAAIGSEYFGGSLNADEGTYTFTITSHIKDYIKGKISDPSLYLFVKNTAITPERVALFNGTGPNKINFRLVYTRL